MGEGQNIFLLRCIAKYESFQDLHIFWGSCLLLGNSDVKLSILFLLCLVIGGGGGGGG